MKPHWAMIGLALDIMGAFFLAVEAIKVENLRRLRQGFLQPAHFAIRPPRIEFKDKDTSRPQPKPEATPGSVIVLKPRWSVRAPLFIVIYFLLHLLAGILVLGAVDVAFGGVLRVTTSFIMAYLSGFSLWMAVVALLLGLWFGVFALWMLGEVVHTGLVRISRLLVDFFEFVECQTASGVVGIIGFGLMVLGFLLQMYSNYLSL